MANSRHLASIELALPPRPGICTEDLDRKEQAPWRWKPIIPPVFDFLFFFVDGCSQMFAAAAHMPTWVRRRARMSKRACRQVGGVEGEGGSTQAWARELGADDPSHEHTRMHACTHRDAPRGR
jgi:hypothetical protein